MMNPIFVPNSGEPENERAVLLAGLDARGIIQVQEQSLVQFSQSIAEGSDNADLNYAAHRGIIETSGIEATRAHEEESWTTGT
jgi:hypothetical protein